MKKFVVKSLMRLMGSMPLRLHYCFAGLLAFLASRVFRYRVGIVEKNLAASFPGRDARELKRIKYQFYRHFADIIVETVWFGACRGPKRLRNARLVEISNVEVLNRMYENAPSVMVLMSHAGNWELIGGMASYNYTDEPSCFTEQNFSVVYLKQKNRMWDEILRDNRTAPLIDPKGFPGYLEARQAMRYVFEHQNEKKIYNFITDQHPYFRAKDFLKVTFMHRECESMRGAAELACRFGMAVCYLSMPVESRGHYKLTYVPICESATVMPADEVMRRYYELLESDIEAQPWNYLWTHNRWKKFPK
ncbi:MAG: lysophospholipid acyltransferase family protein [Bacteroidales bacterium]|nr:lysophospholipid acyltransferase family protein [Bacteroidales bacterium]